MNGIEATLSDQGAPSGDRCHRLVGANRRPQRRGDEKRRRGNSLTKEAAVDALYREIQAMLIRDRVVLMR